MGHKAFIQQNIFYVDTNGLNTSSHDFLKKFPPVFYPETGSQLYKIKKPGSSFEVFRVDLAPVYIIDTNKSSKEPIDNLREIFYLHFKEKYVSSIGSGYTPDCHKNEGYDVNVVNFDA